jgi:microcystin-dependent protein
MSLSGLVFRQTKGAPLTSSEGDSNLRKIRDAFNALEQLFLTVLKPDGTLRDGAVATTAVIADGIITAAKLAGDARIPAGTILPFGGGTAPNGYYLCDGAQYSRTSSADLFAAVGTTWGAGDGSTTFNVPDLRGKTVIGEGTGAGLTNRILGQSLGEESHLLTGDESGIQEHSHTFNWSANSCGSGSSNITGSVITPGSDQSTETTEANAIDPHNNMQPSAVVKWIIKY